MEFSDLNNSISHKKTENNRKKKGLRVRADKNIVSDTLGSYTGTPVNRTAPENLSDLYPEQDADDL